MATSKAAKKGDEADEGSDDDWEDIDVDDGEMEDVEEVDSGEEESSEQPSEETKSGFVVISNVDKEEAKATGQPSISSFSIIDSSKQNQSSLLKMPDESGSFNVIGDSASSIADDMRGPQSISSYSSAI